MLAAMAVALIAASGIAVQVIPNAYAAAAAGSSAITEGACSTGSFAENLLASVAASCGPNFSGSAAGEVAICSGEDGTFAVGIQGTCSISN